MIIWDYFDKRAKRLGILDTKLAQAAAICVAFVMVKLFPQIMELNVWWFIVLGVIFAIKPLVTFYSRNDVKE
jgi:hypothetical protein